MKKLLIILFCFSFGMLYAQETATLFIQDGSDDAYQYYYLYFASTDSVGDIFVDQDYLSMGFDAWIEDPVYLTHHIGLRFVNVPIPPGSIISSAAIQFTSFSANAKPDRVHIRGEKNPSPQSYANEPFNITNRARTDTFVRWNMPEWQAMIPGPAQKTPNLKYIIQELIDQLGWAVNKPMAFEIYGFYTLLTDTTLPRQSCAWEYMGDMYAPILTITYIEPSSIEEQGVAQAMSVFPNPVSDKFTLSFTELMEGKYDISLFDLQGRMICSLFSGNLPVGDIQFVFSTGEYGLKAGVYLLSVQNQTNRINRKIIVRL